MRNSADPDQLASSKANWSGSTLLLRQGMSCSAREGLRMLCLASTNMSCMAVTQMTFHMGRVKRKCAFEHAQQAYIQIFLRIRKVSGPLLSTHTFCSIKWLCQRTVKALIRLRGCAGHLGICFPFMPKHTFSHGAVYIICKAVEVHLCHMRTVKAHFCASA